LIKVNEQVLPVIEEDRRSKRQRYEEDMRAAQAKIDPEKMGPA
jgi:hypothetical protein